MLTRPFLPIFLCLILCVEGAYRARWTCCGATTCRPTRSTWESAYTAARTRSPSTDSTSGYLFNYISQCDFLGLPQDSYLRVDRARRQRPGLGRALADRRPRRPRRPRQLFLVQRPLPTSAPAFNVAAFAPISFSSNNHIELFGLHNFGATFSVPSLVTIGPNFRVYGQLGSAPAFHADVEANGYLKGHRQPPAHMLLHSPLREYGLALRAPLRGKISAGGHGPPK